MHIRKFFFRKKPCIHKKLLHTWVYNLHIQCCFKVQVLKGATEGVKIRVRGQVTGCLVVPVHQCKLNPASTHSAKNVLHVAGQSQHNSYETLCTLWNSFTLLLGMKTFGLLDVKLTHKK